MKYLLLPVVTGSLLLGAGCAPSVSVSPDPIVAPAQQAESSTMPAIPVTTAAARSTYASFTKAGYDADLARGKPVMLFFYASWCPFCQKQDPIIEYLYAEQKEDLGVDTFRVHYADSQTTDVEKAFAKAFGVSSQHTFILLGKDGKEVARSVGPMTAEQVRLFFAKAK